MKAVFFERLSSVSWIFVAGVVVVVFVAGRAHALTIKGTVADKNLLLGYLINQGGGGNPNSFAYLTNSGVDGESILIADPTLARNHFGSRMADAAALNQDNTERNPLKLNVGKAVPRVFFGAFQYDPNAVMNPTLGHQTLDLEDVLFMRAFSDNNLLGGTDVILHEVYEGIVGLGGVGFFNAHVNAGYVEENSNRTSYGNRGRRVVDPLRPDSFNFLNPSTGHYRFRTAWDLDFSDQVPPRIISGYLQIFGRLVGGVNYTVTDIQRGYTGEGGESSTLYDVRVNKVDFVAIPEPSSMILLIMCVATVALQRKIRHSRWSP